MHWLRDILRASIQYYQSQSEDHSTPLETLIIESIERQRRWPQESQSDTANQTQHLETVGLAGHASGIVSATPRPDAAFSMMEVEKHQFDAEVIDGVLQSKDSITKPIRIPRSSSSQSCPLCSNLENVSKFTQSQAKSGSGGEGPGRHFIVAIDWQIS
jgi:hypothetical protein